MDNSGHMINYILEEKNEYYIPKVAQFEKVSLEEFEKHRLDIINQNRSYTYIAGDIKNLYDSIKYPTRATEGSGGYDFYAPHDIVLERGESAVIYTGIRAQIVPGWILAIFPRSGHGFKYHSRLANTVGIIDSDYYGSDNEGHIMVKLTNGGVLPFEIHNGERFCQGIFLPYGITFADHPLETKRNGGFGSTGTM